MQLFNVTYQYLTLCILFAVEPTHVSPIFSIDTETGVLTVNGRGPYLDANGTSGMLNVNKLILLSRSTFSNNYF